MQKVLLNIALYPHRLNFHVPVGPPENPWGLSVTSSLNPVRWFVGAVSFNEKGVIEGVIKDMATCVDYNLQSLVTGSEEKWTFKSHSESLFITLSKKEEGVFLGMYTSSGDEYGTVTLVKTELPELFFKKPDIN